MAEFSQVSSVRAIINHFENKCSQEVRLNRALSKSFSGLSNLERKSKSVSISDETDIFIIEHQLASHILKTKSYISYVKENQIAFQNELIGILGNLSNIDTNNNNTIFYKKKELINIIKMQFDELNEKLPNISGKNSSDAVGDFTYKRFGTTRSTSLGGVPQNRLPSLNTQRRPLSLGTSSEIFGRSTVPSTPQVYTQEQPKFDVLHTAPQVLEGKLDSAISPTSPIQKSRTLTIGGLSGTRHHQVGENGFQLRSPSSEGYLSNGNNSGTQQTGMNGCLSLVNEEQSELDLPRPRKSRNKTMIIGGVLGTKQWVGTNKSPEPHSTFGTRQPSVNPDAPIHRTGFSSDSSENNIERVYKPNHEFSTNKNNGFHKDVDSGMQSVNLLRRFFEQKSVSTEQLKRQESFEIFEVENVDRERYELEGQQQDPEVDYDEVSTGNTLEELSRTEDSDTGEVEDDSYDREVEIEDKDTSPEIENAEVEVVASKFRQVPDVDEIASVSSEQSIYVDPID